MTITLPEGDPITAEADDEGNWEATVPELSEGDTVTVVAEAEGKDPSAPITVTVDGVRSVHRALPSQAIARKAIQSAEQRHRMRQLRF